MARTRHPTPLSNQHLEQIAALFKVLGEPMRLRILQTVCKQPLCVGDIVRAAGSTQANVSKHLSLMGTAGVLHRERNGQRVFYSVREPLVLKLCETVRAHWIS